MSHQTTKKKSVHVALTLYALYLLGSTAFAAKPNEPRRYNAGVTAYQSNDFAQAAAAFENATASKDRSLQERALYNLGNTTYRLGQEQPARAQQLWQRAIKHYDSALALNPQDADAKFNQEFVEKKLEELKKQQEQQKQQQQNQKQQDKNPEQNQQGSKQDQQKQDSKSDESEQQKQQEPKQSQEHKDQQQQQQAQQDKSSQPEQKPEEKGSSPENYDKMQATALLNDLRENEQNWNFFPEVQMKDLKDSGPPAKDW